MTHPLSFLTSGAISSPFTQLRKLLAGIPAGHANPIELTIGEPREAMPDFIAAKLAEATALYGKYPPIRGAGDARLAISEWLSKRYQLPSAVDPEREILMLSGSREGLFFACLPAVGRKEITGRPAILMCNPYYSAYVAGALAVGAEPIYLNATKATGFLPDLDELARDESLLARTAALFINSPANPQGAVADRAYILKALALARAYDFMLFLDECYSEIYTEAAPVGGLEVAIETPERFRNLVVFNSLSKRSNLPGLRSGFCAGDEAFLEAYGEVRNMCAPTVPLPVQHASAAIWRDEAHVEISRNAYRDKFLIADKVLGDRYGYRRPAGGFCLWLNLSQFGGGAQAAVTLWQRAGVKVIPGSFLAQTGRDGTNPGADYVRVAMVQDSKTIQEALERTISVLR
ncbi:aminotransferase class I/II-fold pyridoxal phosphate-dependent enzyme [Hyphomicrobium sp.]|uniref:aminotransferase class I/II-fold pyridoxal phosphate-dependent enzyme n=1 Tax=Hyphomicrobium sp. TaxID=82 RepID=UPI002D787137|nr:aminotransferase class I/II-fold pyridoxal phosphate-dependent enzyme [Hyphomicrobium sp.]HET6388799.1 aminotransferase class I/II-fold pyridoxal phosphate-dependent enzyme [Hyphomicrobium sp.]